MSQIHVDSELLHVMVLKRTPGHRYVQVGSSVVFGAEPFCL